VLDQVVSCLEEIDPILALLYVTLFTCFLTGLVASLVFFFKTMNRAALPFEPILPYAFAFVAGAMIFVVIEEVVPEAQQDKYTDISTMGFIAGFTIMMSMDVALG
jgi:ZIP family zinc transporter